MNLQAAAAASADALNLSDVPKSDWSQNERVDYINTLRSTILSAPQNYTDATVAIAQRVNTNDLALQGAISIAASANLDAVYSASQGGADYLESLASAVDNLTTGSIAAASALGDVLHGSATGLSITGKIAPFIVPAAIVLFLYLATRSASERVRRNRLLT